MSNRDQAGQSRSKSADALSRRVLLAAVAGVLSTQSVFATSDTWMGTTDSLWSTASNWALNSSAPGAGETATFSLDAATVNNRTIIDIGALAAIGAIQFDSGSAAAYTIGTTAGGGTLTLATPGNAVTMAGTVVNNQLINANLALATVGSYTISNESLTNGLTFAGGITSTNAGIKILNVTGAGNTTINGAVTATAGSMNLLKTGTGTLVLSGNSTFAGNGTQGNIPLNALFPVVLREGTTRITGGTHNVTGELVMGGVVVDGGAGTNNRLQVDGGTLAVNGWFSIGRGNGVGNVSSDLVLNNNAVVTAVDLSGGYHGGSTANMPRGSITLNGTSLLSVGWAVNFAESAGSQYTMNINDSATFRQTNNGQQTRVGQAAGAAGTINVNGGTASFERDLILGDAGASSGQMNINGGYVNVANATKRWLIINRADGSSGQLTVNSGTLVLNANTDIRFSTATTASGISTLTLNGGYINGSAASVIDLKQSTNTAANNTVNLNGGTLTIAQILSANPTGTRTLNLNGALIKATGNNASFIAVGTDAGATVNVRNGGAIIDSNGFNITSVSPLNHSNVGGDNATDGGLTKRGLGVLTLSGANNTYTGPTVINGGGLAVSGNLSGTSGVQVAAGATFNARGTVNIASAITSSGTVDLTSTSAGTLTASALNLTNGTLNFEFAGGVNDVIALAGGAAITSSKLNLAVASGALNAGSYTLMTGASGLNSGLTLGSVPPGFFNFSLATSTPTATILTVTGNPTPATAFWTGLGSTGSADANNNWGAGSGIGVSNWSTTADGLSDPKQVPGPSTAVTLTASNAVGSAGALNTKLDASYSISGLTVDVPVSTGITSVGVTTTGQTLTIGSGGLTQAATSNAGATLSGTGTVVLNGSQTWANNSSSAMTVNSPVNALSGATALTVGGTGSGDVTLGGGLSDGGGTVSLLVNKASGAVNIGGTSTYAGPTTINAGVLNVSGALTTPGVLQVGGEGGTGSMNVTPTGNVVANNVVSIGYRTGTGTLNMTGGTLSSNNDFRVGASDANGATYIASGTFNMSGGVGSLSSITVGRGNFSDNNISGTVNLSSGVLTSVNDVILGYAGSGTSKMSISGGTFNVATTATKWMMLGFWDTTKGQLDISGGALNLNQSSSLVLGRGDNNAGWATINQTGGSITTFSDNATTATGSGGLDMQYRGSATFASTYNLDGGTLSIYRIWSSTTTGTRVFNFNGGTLRPTQTDAAFMNLGVGSATANVRDGGAKIDTNGLSVTIAQPLLHSNISGDNAIDGGLTKSGLGTLTLSGNSTYTGPTTVNAGALVMNKSSSGGGAITVASGAGLGITSSTATGSLATSAMTLDTTTLSFNLGAVTPTDPLFNVSGALSRTGTNVVNVSGSMNSGTITLIQYAGGETGTGNFTLGTLPNRTTATLYDLGAGKVDLSIVVSAIKWSGLGDGSWTNAVQTPKNWTDGAAPVDYTAGDPVLFDDSATGTVSVTIPADVSPAGITVNNSSKHYTFNGPGKITGAGALVKSGTGTLTINAPVGTTGNDYSGGTVINAGTVEIAGTSDATANLNILGTGSIVNNGALLFNRPSGGANLHFDYTLLRPSVSGSGSLIIGSNVATDGAHTFDGAVTVKSGFLYFLDNPAAMGSAVGGTTVEYGAGLQVWNASRNYGLEAITMSGDGPTYNAGVSYEGAIYVASGVTGTFGGPITLAGDTSFRADGTLLFSGNIAGSSYTVTKNGGGRLVLSGTATYGQSNINAGALQVGAGGTTGNLGSGDVVLANGTLDVNRTDTYDVTNKVTGVGAIANLGTGTAIYSSMNSDFTGSVVANNGTLVLAGMGYPTTLTVNANGVLKMTNDLYGAYVPSVFVNSNNAETGALELSGSVSSPFTGGTVTVAGRNNTSSSIRSTGGTNTLGGNIVLAAGGGSYRFEAATGATFNLQAAVAPAAALGGDRTISFAGSGVGSMTGAITLGGAATLSVAKVGSGTWTMDAAHSYNGNTTVNGGTLVVKQVAQTPITSGAGANIQNGYLVMEHGADGGVFANNVASLLDAGYDQAIQFSTGTYRSSAADATKGLGWKDDGNSTTIGYAYYGDANLDGKVDSTDFSALSGNYGKLSGQVWVNGDFDYNGKVNTLDFNQLAGNFGLEIIAPVASPVASPAAGLGSVVPEPTTLSLVSIGAGMMLRRRRK